MTAITAILTVHNTKREYVTECIESIERQTFTDWQILIVDDYSITDYSWLEKLSKIYVIRNECNLGLCRSVNKALALTNSDYIVRIGSDDRIAHNFFEREIEFLQHHRSYVACCSQLQKFGRSTVLIERPQKWTLCHSDDDLIKSFRGYGYAGGMMFRRSALQKCHISEKYRICEDFDFHLQLLKVGKIKSIHEPLYFYRSHETNLCKQIRQAEKNVILNQIIKERMNA